jgi:LPS O-antigen subunit length determinant protein (WzzB/FepE family)
MNEYEKEIELMDYLNVLWKRKWLIIIPTFFFAVLAWVYSFLLPPVWEVDAIIQPSQYILQTQDGTYKEILIANPKQIAAQINEALYNHIIATELNLDIREIPKFKAENLKNSKMVKISIKANDVEKAKLILFSLLNYLKRRLDKKLDTEIKSIDSQIKSKEIEKFTKEEEIKAYKNKLNIIKQRKEEIEKEISNTRKRVETLEKEQRSILKKENRSETESLALLLYSNEIQQSSQYYSTLNELLSSKKIEEEDINLEIKNKEEAAELLEIVISNLNETKGRIDYAQLIKEPTSSLSPVAPKKKINVLIAGIFSLMIFTMLAFFLEYIEKHKVKSKGK